MSIRKRSRLPHSLGCGGPSPEECQVIIYRLSLISLMYPVRLNSVGGWGGELFNPSAGRKRSISEDPLKRGGLCERLIQLHRRSGLTLLVTFAGKNAKLSGV